MSVYNILLDKYKTQSPLSDYITEQRNINNNAELNINPSLFKFFISEKKDVVKLVKDNKYRMLADSVTDAFVSTFFINYENNNNNEILKMLIDYQYHFINYYIMTNVSVELGQPKQSCRSGASIPEDNLCPLQADEHIILNFKGGSTMFFLYNKIIAYLREKNRDLEQFNDIKDDFKISDIDLSLNIIAENSYRYYQIESICCKLLAKSMEELSNRFEFIFLKLINNQAENQEENQEITAELNDLENKLINLNTLDLHINDIHYTIGFNQVVNPIYNDIYRFKLLINEYKHKLKNEEFNDELENRINIFIDKFFITNIENEGDNIVSVNIITKTVDMLEISYLSEFIQYVHSISLNERYVHQFICLDTLAKYLLDSRFKYLSNNLYNIPKFNNLITNVHNNLRNINNSTLKKAIKNLTDINENTIIKARTCNSPQRQHENSNYYQEDRYLINEVAGNVHMYNLRENDHINMQLINFGGVKNFMLKLQDSSNYPQLKVETSNTGLYNDEIKHIKELIGNVNIRFGNNENNSKDIKFADNKHNIHFVSINKSILSIKKDFIQTFNLFRIKFNLVLDELVESVIVSDNEECEYEIINSLDTPSEFLDVSISSKDDGFHHNVKEIEEKRPGIVFNFNLPQMQNALYGMTSRITSYNIEIFAADLANVLYNQQVIPWFDLKYKKRLSRLLFYIFNTLHIHHKNHISPLKVHHQITQVFKPFFDRIDTDKINFNNIFGGQFITTNNVSIDDIVHEFIDHISVENSNTYINSASINKLILYNTNINRHLILKDSYKFTCEFYSFTIICLVLMQKIINEVNNGENRNNIIHKNVLLIKHLYDKNGYVYEDKHFINKTEEQINTIIINDFIVNLSTYIGNIKHSIETLEKMFFNNFEFNIYQRIDF